VLSGGALLARVWVPADAPESAKSRLKMEVNDVPSLLKWWSLLLPRPLLPFPPLLLLPLPFPPFPPFPFPPFPILPLLALELLLDLLLLFDLLFLETLPIVGAMVGEKVRVGESVEGVGVGGSVRGRVGSPVGLVVGGIVGSSDCVGLSVGPSVDGASVTGTSVAGVTVGFPGGASIGLADGESVPVVGPGLALGACVALEVGVGGAVNELGDADGVPLSTGLADGAPVSVVGLGLLDGSTEVVGVDDGVFSPSGTVCCKDGAKVSARMRELGDRVGVSDGT